MLPLAGLDWVLQVGNYPNPMRDETAIVYTLPRAVGDLSIVLHDLDGRLGLRAT